MGTHLKMTASDGHKFGAYRVRSSGNAQGRHRRHSRKSSALIITSVLSR